VGVRGKVKLEKKKQKGSEVERGGGGCARVDVTHVCGWAQTPEGGDSRKCHEKREVESGRLILPPVGRPVLLMSK